MNSLFVKKFTLFLSLLILSIPLVSFAEEVVTPNTTEAVSQKSAYQIEIDKRNEEIAKLEAEIKQYQGQIEITAKEAATLKSLIKQLDLTRAKLSTNIKLTEKKISGANTTLNKLSEQIEDKNLRVKNSREVIAKNIRIVSEKEGESTIEILLSESSFSDVWVSLDQTAQFERAVKDHIDELREVKQSLVKDKTAAENVKKTLVSLKSNLGDQKILVDQNKNEKTKVLKETSSKESEYKKLLAERLEKKEQLEAEILDFESKIKLDVDISKLPSAGKGILSWPVSSVRITQYFGKTPFATKNPQVYNGMGHNGIDFGVPIGTPIKSSASGVVYGTGNTDTACYGVSYGKWVLVRHENGLATLYAHLSLIKVSTGDNVQSGDIIGYSGNTGYSTGPHLHFTVYAADAVHISGPTEYKSRICGTYLRMPVAPKAGYLNPLSYL
ncbi:MAG: peptidoglycan DD-metalloendopeptidase family protein [Candidatus Paceibacterota bacterium]|jgi:murein DD-endopeptidase MepM/ murein hydrolase activator NlpD